MTCRADSQPNSHLTTAGDVSKSIVQSWDPEQTRIVCVWTCAVVPRVGRRPVGCCSHPAPWQPLCTNCLDLPGTPSQLLLVTQGRQRRTNEWKKCWRDSKYLILPPSQPDAWVTRTTSIGPEGCRRLWTSELHIIFERCTEYQEGFKWNLWPLIAQLKKMAKFE